MKKQKKLLLRISSVAVAAGVILFQFLPMNSVSAAQITTRSLTLQSGSIDSNADGINDGGSMPGGTVSHAFAFSLPSNTSIGSIKFQYCTTAAPVPNGVDCNTPTGMSATGATLGNETGATGFTIDSTSANEVVITRTAAAYTGAASYRLDSVVNPSTTNQTFFVRISTHATADGSGAPTDTGSVAASTATPIVLDGTMPESLVFCTGRTIGLTSTLPDCTTATSGNISFDQLFSPTDTATATSQMAASTNAGAGYAITVNGPTLTSGSNTISAMASPTTLVLGSSQFGMNLRANTATFDNQTPTPQPLGSVVAPAANGTNYRGQATADYNTDNNFEFTGGDTVANSYNATPGGTDAQIFTIGYVVNVPGSQPAGTYTTTLTYICTPTF